MEAAARAVTFPAHAEGWTVAPTQGASGFPLLAQPPALPLQADCDNNAKSNTTRRAIAPFAKVTQCCTSLPTHLIRRSGKIPTLTQRKNETEERGGGVGGGLIWGAREIQHQWQLIISFYTVFGHLIRL